MTKKLGKKALKKTKPRGHSTLGRHKIIASNQEVANKNTASKLSEADESDKAIANFVDDGGTSSIIVNNLASRVP